MTTEYPNCPKDSRYSIGAAAIKLQVSKATIRRWMDGYYYSYKGKVIFKEPILGFKLNEATQMRYIPGQLINNLFLGKRTK